MEAEAFTGAAMYAAAIPEGCVSIGARAFADTPLWEIDIPATVTDIDDTAFEGLTDLLIITPEDSPAIQYAERKGIKYLPY